MTFGVAGWCAPQLLEVGGMHFSVVSQSARLMAAPLVPPGQCVCRGLASLPVMLTDALCISLI